MAHAGFDQRIHFFADVISKDRLILNASNLFNRYTNDILLFNGKWFEPRSLSRLSGLIVRVRVVPRRTVVGDIDRRFDNLSGSHHQSHVNCVSFIV